MTQTAVVSSNAEHRHFCRDAVLPYWTIHVIPSLYSPAKVAWLLGAFFLSWDVDNVSVRAGSKGTAGGRNAVTCRASQRNRCIATRQKPTFFSGSTCVSDSLEGRKTILGPLLGLLPIQNLKCLQYRVRPARHSFGPHPSAPVIATCDGPPFGLFAQYFLIILHKVRKSIYSPFRSITLPAFGFSPFSSSRLWLVAVSSGDNVQIPWQVWHAVTCDDTPHSTLHILHLKKCRAVGQMRKFRQTVRPRLVQSFKPWVMGHA